MTLQHSKSDLQDFVKRNSRFSQCISNSQSIGWNSQVMEFKPFVRSVSFDNTENFYFRLFHAHSSMKYVKEKYRKLFKQFSGLFVNVNVELVSQKVHDCVYLIRGTQNYFSLQRLIQKGQRKVLSLSYILSLLEFFDQILKVNKKMNLKINLNASTILQKDGMFKLADYNLLFHPNNLKSHKDDLELKLIAQMKYVIFDILQLKNRQTRQNFEETCHNLINHLKQRKSQSNGIFVQIIEKFFNSGTILTDEIINFTSRKGFEVNDTLLLDSILTASDISVPLLQRQQTSLSDEDTTITKPKINKKKLMCLVLSLFCLLVVAGGLTYYFFIRDIDCGNFHYKQNRQCLRCPDSCYSCIGPGQYNCTYCITSYWLVLKDINDKTGKCSVDCMGFKDSSTMHCLPQN